MVSSMPIHRDIVGGSEASHKEQVLRLVLHELAAGGRGVGRAPDGRVVFAAGGLAGEEVVVRLTAERKSYLEGRVVEVIAPSPHRVEPFCPHFGRCGGCNLQHLAPEAQATEKTAWVARALSRLDAPAPALLASPLNLGCRNRVRLAAAGGRLGFYVEASRELAAVERCPVAAPGINRVLAGMGESLAADGGSDLVWLEAVAAGEGPAWVTLGLAEHTPGDRRRRLRRLAREAGAAGVRLAQGKSLEPWPLSPDSGVVYHQDGALALRAFPGLFCQVNFAVNRLMIGLVGQLAAQMPPGPALDLYAGSGNFGLPLAAAGRRVLAVESSRPAVEAASWQARLAGLSDLHETKAGQATQAAQALAEAGEHFALAVLDPPRAGARDLMEPLSHLAPGRIIYVSCHAAALARDAAALAAAGYRLSQLWAVDQFPHTGHVEAVLALDLA